jgi:DNA-binding protein HU-beta
MKKSKLVEQLADRAGLSRDDASKAIDALFSANGGIIARELKSGNKVQITGFGTFESKKRGGRTGRNPRTGKEIEIAPSTGTHGSGDGV